MTSPMITPEAMQAAVDEHRRGVPFNTFDAMVRSAVEAFLAAQDRDTLAEVVSKTLYPRAWNVIPHESGRLRLGRAVVDALLDGPA